MKKFDDITIVFCVPKGVFWTRAAIESFKLFNPEYADKIVVFNDECSSINLLKKYCNKIITWKNFKRPIDVLERVGLMYQECAMQVDTKYIVFIDNDTITHRPWLTEKIIKMQKEDAKIFAPITFNPKRKTFEYPEEYRELIPEGNVVPRFVYFGTIIDREYFINNYGIYGYMGKPEYYEDDMFDVGTEFYYFCIKNNIKFITEHWHVIDLQYLIHVRPNPLNPNSVSCATKYDEIKEFKELGHYEKCVNVCNKLNLNFEAFYKRYSELYI